MLVALSYLAGNLHENWQSISAASLQIPPQSFAMIIIGATGTLLLGAIYHVLLLADFEDHGLRPSRVAYAYALGQIARYVPGKIFGVLYQAELLSGGTRPRNVIAALVVQTAHDYAWTFAFCCPILMALWLHDPAPLLLLPAFLILLHITHRKRLSQRILASIPLAMQFVQPPRGKNHHALIQTLVQSTVWIPLVAAIWMAFVPILGGQSSLIAALFYPISAVLSLLVVVLPSGMVIREAIFLWLGDMNGLPQQVMLLIAVLVRICLTLGEILTVVILGIVDWMKQRKRNVPA